MDKNLGMEIEHKTHTHAREMPKISEEDKNKIYFKTKILKCGMNCSFSWSSGGFFVSTLLTHRVPKMPACQYLNYYQCVRFEIQMCWLKIQV
jgi:hypothetical protein